MKASLKINSQSPDFSKVNVTLSLESETNRKVKVSFENASLGIRGTVNGLPFVEFTGKSVTVDINIADKRNENLSSIFVYANVEENNRLIAIATASIPNKTASKSKYSADIQPPIVEYGDKFTFTISGETNSTVILSIENKKTEVHIDESGIGSITLESTDFAKPYSKSLQQIKVFIITKENVKYDVSTLCVAPINAAQLATAASGLMPSLDIKSPTEIESLTYPSSGLPETIDETVKRLTISGDAAYSPSAKDFVRINGYSYCKATPNTVLVALSSQDINKVANSSFLDDKEIATTKSSRVYVLESKISSQYTAPYRNALVIGTDLSVGECSNVIAIEVDADIWDDLSLTSIWVLDGSLSGHQFKIMAQYRDIPNIWYIVPVLEETYSLAVADNSCFNFIAFGTKTFTHPDSIAQPLPYIEVNGYAVSAINPQIATNPNSAPDNTDQYVYIISEGNVNGVPQLFFYSLNLNGDEVYGWKQLTFDGENKNARIACDKHGNLHIVWESSRCQPGQLYYGVLGPDSRALINEAFISSIDKQADARVNSTESIVPNATYGSLKPINLREVDGYGAFYGDMWVALNSGGSVTLTDDVTLTTEGNPADNKFAAVATLKRDENNNYFDGYFSQLSFEVAFDLVLSCTDTDPNKNFSITSTEALDDLYTSWKGGFTPLNYSYKNVNVYDDIYSNRYTIDNYELSYDKIIPIVGSYKIAGMVFPSSQLKLRHFMLAVVPEKAIFFASNIETLADWTTRTGGLSVDYLSYVKKEVYTGKFKLALITETSANLNDRALAEQKYQVLRMFGDTFAIQSSHSYRVSVHYGKMRKQTLDFRSSDPSLAENDVRFIANLIVTVDENVQCGENFVVDFSDMYNQFQIGLGTAIVHEYRPFNVKPFDGTLNDDIKVKMEFTNIAIGPHSVTDNPFSAALAVSDRTVSTMYVPALTAENDSADIWDEIYGIDISDRQNRYYLNFGLDRSKIRLSQIPITFLGRNTQPSIVIDDREKLHIAWQSNREENWEVYYTSNSLIHNPFRFDTRITSSEGDSLSPSISVDGHGRKLIAWQDSTDGEYQILAARNTNVYEDDGKCELQFLSESIGFNEYSDTEYEYAPTFANICELNFYYTNTSDTVKNYHFTADFYYDTARLSTALNTDSRFDITNWYYEQNSEVFPMPYNGVPLSPGESARITYRVSKELEYANLTYTVLVSADDGITITPFDTITFFCPNEQYPLCNVPCLYENTNIVTKSVNFRVTFYRDSGLQDVALSASTNTDNAKWYIGDNQTFPPSGINVNAGESISVYYNPDILPEELSYMHDLAPANFVLCNVRYYVVIESLVDSVYTTIDQFAFECSCSDIKGNIWRKDTVSKEWQCSGQGGMDIRITNTTKPAVKVNTSASKDGIAYIAWEDHRGVTDSQITPGIYFTVWDANNDAFYSRSQGFFDKQLVSSGFFSPAVVVGDLQHPAFIYTNGNIIVRKTVDMYTTTSSSSSSSSTDYILDNQLSDEELALTVEDVAACIVLDVYEKDVIRLYHEDSDTPVALVDKCKIRLSIKCPHSSYAIRFKNETDTEWSDWISILPKLYSSSSAASLSDFLPAYFIAEDLILTEWVLSSGNGNKTVSCEIMTHFGKTPVITRNIIARYKELQYTVEFYSSDTGDKIQSSIYNGYPVISLKQIKVIKEDVTTILDEISDSSEVTIYVKFDDADYLNELLAPNLIDRWGGAEKALSFDVIMSGKSLFELPLTLVSSSSSSSFDFDNPPTEATKVETGVYKGTFTIEKDDGFDNKDGLATIVLRIPSPCISQPATYICPKLYPTPSDIKDTIVQEVNTREVTNEPFYQKYNKDLLCTFMTPSCVNGTEPTETDTTDAIFPIEEKYVVSCNTMEWTVGRRAEPCYFNISAFNSTSWLVESPEFEFDFSDSRIDYLSFTGSELDDIIVMVKPNETITITGGSCPSSSSSSSNGKIGRSVTFTIPATAFVFKHTTGAGIYYCHGPSECNIPSAAKIFSSTGGTALTIEEGSYTNDGTDGTSVWGVSTAQGKTYISPGNSGVLAVNLTNGISIAELTANGFVTSNGILRFKLIYIPSGQGFANISMTCAASCDG